MKEKLDRLTENIDFALLFAVVFLCFYGLLVLFSSTRLAVTTGSDPYFFVKRQSLWVLSGFIFLTIIMFIDYHNLERYSKVIYFGAIVLLMMVIISGRSTYGARRWLAIGPFDFQPSEFAKIALIMFLADFLSKNKLKFDNFLYYLLPFIYTGLLMLLVFVQPDLGTSLVYLAILIIMLFVAGIKIKFLVFTFFAGISSVPVLWIFLKDYQKNRLILFLNPNLDPLGGGYNVIQSRIAIGSGGFLGNGIFRGLQSQLNFLPAQHTDFIFSVVGEELGFVGTILLLGLYAIVLWRGIKIALEARDLLGSLLATGAVSFLFFHIVVNIGMAMGMLPATGLPLPFLSYGGSFMISNLMAIGILLNVELHKVKW
ncbi:MAG: rod shape-determining protein RodA [Candidatus Atribacteria bacterium]|nr:rod shape-determining protein RodA [Candidatus Atribacteria bacterium]